MSKPSPLSHLSTLTSTHLAAPSLPLRSQPIPKIPLLPRTTNDHITSMKFFTATAAIFATAAAESISYDPGYYDGSRSMNVIACSDGGKGLETRDYRHMWLRDRWCGADTLSGYGWQTQGQIPSCESSEGIPERHRRADLYQSRTLAAASLSVAGTRPSVALAMP